VVVADRAEDCNTFVQYDLGEDCNIVSGNRLEYEGCCIRHTLFFKRCFPIECLCAVFQTRRNIWQRHADGAGGPTAAAARLGKDSVSRKRGRQLGRAPIAGGG